MSKQLNALDATFLELEEADQGAHMHIGVVMVFEPRPDGRGAPSVAELAKRLGQGLEELPRFRQRLSSPATGGLSWPDWLEDERFDFHNHLRAVALPKPGGDAALLEWAGEFFSERLDRTRPLWEIVVVDGLADGRWALASKTHHCMVDGVGSVDIGHFVVDTEPHPDRPSSPIPPSPGAPEVPQPASLLGSVGGAASGLARRATEVPVKVARAGVGLIGGTLGLARHPERARDALRRSRALADVIVQDELVAAPRTSLNVPIGAKRRLALMRASLDDLKEVKRSLGGTVNDVVLAVTTGGIRRLLADRGDPLPDQGLRAMVPVNIRSAGEELAMGNRITSLYVGLPVGVEDPLERYASQVEEDKALKSGSQALGTTTLIDITEHAPPVIHSFLARALFATRLFNVTVTNVPGPQIPLYGFGSRMTEAWPLVPLAADHAVGLAATSYDGNVFFMLNADRDSMPDLDLLADGMEKTLEELLEAARAPSGAVD
jgi:diacylglycerol O-acyltransferase / wax synthase